MKAAIELLRGKLEIYESMIDNPAICLELRQGIAFLEAAEKVDKKNAIDYFWEGMSQGRDHVEVMSPYRADHNIKLFDKARDEIRALLESLPDKPDEEKP